MQSSSTSHGYSPRSTSLPVGYSLRLATQEDALRILYFVKIGHGSFVDKVYMVLLILLPMLAAYGVFIFLASVRSSATFYGLNFFNVFSSIVFQFILVSFFYFLFHHKTTIGKYKKYLKNKHFSIWLIESENTIAGYVLCVHYTNCTFIGNILISKTDRNKGLGNFLVRHVTSFYKSSIYLVCNYTLKNFYYHNGFLDVDDADLPNELSRLHGNPGKYIMLFK
jgi:N-acetylglutamate synthase-like GNAT family acetyltransferase